MQFDPVTRGGSPGLVYIFRQQNEDSSSVQSITLPTHYLLLQQKLL